MTWRMVSRRSIRNIQFGLLIVSTAWGLDYLLPPTEDSKVQNYVESHAYFGLQFWGLIMVLTGLLGLVCEFLLSRNERKHWRFWVGSWFSHATFASMYAMLAVGALASAPLTSPGWAGWRTPVLWLFIAILHTAYARRLEKPISVVRDEEDALAELEESPEEDEDVQRP